MAGRYGPNIITDNLKLYVDAANKESYPQTGTTWTDMSGEGNDGTISGATFASENSKNSVSGGTITNDGEYIIHTFTNDSASENFITDVALTADVLIIAGGGGGGMNMGGGGGAGGLIYRQGISISAGTNAFVVGSGGAGAPAGSTAGQNNATAHPFPVSASAGENTTALGYTAIGGGYGGTDPYTFAQGGTPSSGGSGGGAGGYNNSPYGREDGGAGTAGQGNAGGDGGGSGSGQSGYFSGGGGGAGGVGVEAPNLSHGGVGLQIDIDGNNYYWAAGGGGSTYSSPSNASNYPGADGGLGGGGGGASRYASPAGSGGTGGINNGEDGGVGAATGNPNAPGGDGGANTGSGGGGGGHYNSNNSGGDGGSGIVIVRYHRSFAPRRFYFLFGGDDDDVIVGAISGSFNSAFTISGWFKPTTGASQNAYANLFDFNHTVDYNRGPRVELDIADVNASLQNYKLMMGATHPYYWSSSNTLELSTSEWRNVVYVITTSGSTQTLKAYQNGTLVSTDTNTSTTYHWVGTIGNLALGVGHNTSREWDGNIGNFMTYNRALSAAEVLQNYNALKGRYGL